VTESFKKGFLSIFVVHLKAQSLLINPLTINYLRDFLKANGVKMHENYNDQSIGAARQSVAGSPGFGALSEPFRGNTRRHS